MIRHTVKIRHNGFCIDSLLKVIQHQSLFLSADKIQSSDLVADGIGTVFVDAGKKVVNNVPLLSSILVMEIQQCITVIATKTVALYIVIEGFSFAITQTGTLFLRMVLKEYLISVKVYLRNKSGRSNCLMGVTKKREHYTVDHSSGIIRRVTTCT